MADLKASLLKSLLVCNLNKILNCACYLEGVTSCDLTAIAPFYFFVKNAKAFPKFIHRCSHLEGYKVSLKLKKEKKKKKSKISYNDLNNSNERR